MVALTLMLRVRIVPVKAPSSLRVKMPIVAMVLSFLFLGPRPSRPDGDRQAGGDRRRTCLQAAAQRRMTARRLSCFARNDGPGGPARSSRGVDRQGKKVVGRHCGRGDRGVSRPAARSGHQEADWACPAGWEGTGVPFGLSRLFGIRASG